MSRSATARAAVKAAIDATADQRGVVTPDNVVAAARDEASPLHVEFEWDDTIAAHKHRLDVARSLIREIKYEGEDHEKRAISEVSYVHDPRVKGQAYIPLSQAQKNKKLALGVLNEEFGRIAGALNRAREVAEVLDLAVDLDRMIEDLVRAKQRLSTRLADSGREAENRPNA